MFRTASLFLPFRQFVLLFLCLVLASAAWIESDAYRYAGGALLLLALLDYWRTPSPQRVAIGLAGMACFGWAAYVAARYGFTVATEKPDLKLGSAEGIYLFPVAFTLMGYAFYRFRADLRRLSDLFMLTSLLMLASTINFGAVLTGQRTPFLVQNNTIHASVAAGLIAVAAVSYGELALREIHGRASRDALVRLGLALAVLALCLLGIFGAKSKGVWLALGLTLPLQIAAMLVRLPRRRRRIAGAAAAGLLGLVLVTAAGSLALELEPSALGALALVDALAVKGDLQSVHNAIAAGAVPFSFAERLMLWMNALDVIVQRPVFGAGILWEESWKAARYASLPYNLMHNGYVEILVRYGISGLLFFAVLYAALTLHVLRAARRRLIAASAAKAWLFSLLFFALTLLTNSNNRLAIGESFILISAGFAFCCFYLGQHARNPQIR